MGRLPLFRPCLQSPPSAEPSRRAGARGTPWSCLLAPTRALPPSHAIPGGQAGVAREGGSRWLSHSRAGSARGQGARCTPSGRGRRSQRVSKASQCHPARDSEVSELLTPHSQWTALHSRGRWPPALRGPVLLEGGGAGVAPEPCRAAARTPSAERRLFPRPLLYRFGLKPSLSPGRHFTSVNPLPSDSRLTLAEDWKFKGASRSRTRLLPRVKGTCGAGRGRSHSSLSPQHSRAAGTPVPTRTREPARCKRTYRVLSSRPRAPDFTSPRASRAACRGGRTCRALARGRCLSPPRWRRPDEPSGHPAGAPAYRTEWSQFIAFRKILSTCNSVTFRMVSHIKNCGNFEIWRCKNTESWKLLRVGLRLLTRGKACSREVPNARGNRCDRFITRTRIRCRAA